MLIFINSFNLFLYSSSHYIFLKTPLFFSVIFKPVIKTTTVLLFTLSITVTLRWQFVVKLQFVFLIPSLDLVFHQCNGFLSPYLVAYPSILVLLRKHCFTLNMGFPRDFPRQFICASVSCVFISDYCYQSGERCIINIYHINFARCFRRFLLPRDCSPLSQAKVKGTRRR